VTGRGLGEKKKISISRTKQQKQTEKRDKLFPATLKGVRDHSDKSNSLKWGEGQKWGPSPHTNRMIFY